MAFSTQGNGFRAELNVTPLIDVVLVLLIVFMVLVPTMILRNRVHLAPEKDNGATTLVEKNIEIAISPTSEIAVLGKPYSLNSIKSLVASMSAEQNPPTVFVRSAEQVPYGLVAEVMDACRTAGAKTIALVLPATAPISTSLQ